MEVLTTMRHLCPKPPKTDRKKQSSRNSVSSVSLGWFGTQVAEEQHHSEEEEEEEEAKTGGSDAVKDEERQAGERPVGSQSLM